MCRRGTVAWEGPHGRVKRGLSMEPQPCNEAVRWGCKGAPTTSSERVLSPSQVFTTC